MQIFLDMLSAIVFFILSSILGAWFQRWLARAKPKFTIISVGFQGSASLIKLPEKLISVSYECLHVKDALMPYMGFDILLYQHRETSETIQKLAKSTPLAEIWLSDSESNNAEFMSLLDIKKHPYLNDITIRSCITELIKRNELRDVPKKLDSINNYDRVLELYEVDAGWHLSSGMRNIVFLTKGMVDPNHQSDMKLCAESFSRGIRENINYYTRSFIHASNKENRKLNEFRQLLEDILLPDARLFVELSIHNAGLSSVAIRPHMALKIVHSNLEKKPFILATQKNSQHIKKDEIDNSSRLNPIGKEVIAESFLPETSASPYINIPPGDTQEIVLIAPEPLGQENGEIVKRIYQTGLLKCKVVGRTLSGKTIWSAPAIFSNDITSDDKTALEQIFLHSST